MDETRGKFVLKAPYQPSGDQPQAIEALTKGVNAGMKGQVLLGVTGSGKTFTMASVIAQVQRPTLVIAHNKTLAAQLCSEFRAFFPDSAVEYFVSYYDYYQPEAYIASSDTYIEKDAAINEEIDRVRHSATAALRERRDVIIVASVSCIYSMGDPSEYEGQMVSLRPGMAIGRDDLIRQLIAIQYDRNDVEFERGTFRVRGDVLEIIPAGGKEHGLRIEFFGDEIESISEFEVVSGHTLASLEHASVYPATHYATDQTNLPEKIAVIERDLKEQVDKFTKEGKLLEAERIAQRTNYDIEMMREIGYCSGIENYSRYFDGRKPGDAPYSLLDYFPKGFLCFIDESHVTVPQIRAMYNGDRARKEQLVEYGFRLPSAFDNRPLLFEEFEQRIGQTIFVSATTMKLMPSAAAVIPSTAVASISSIKIMQGAFLVASLNKSRTRDAPTPTYNSIKSEPAKEKNGTPASPATALASRVLPVPGGPTKRAPFGSLAPIFAYFAGL